MEKNRVEEEIESRRENGTWEAKKECKKGKCERLRK